MKFDGPKAVFDEGVRLDCKILRPDSVNFLLLLQLKAGSNMGSMV
jgi:hypothetical protein